MPMSKKMTANTIGAKYGNHFIFISTSNVICATRYFCWWRGSNEVGRLCCRPTSRTPRRIPSLFRASPLLSQRTRVRKNEGGKGFGLLVFDEGLLCGICREIPRIGHAWPNSPKIVPEKPPARFFLLLKGRIRTIGNAWPKQLMEDPLWASYCRTLSYSSASLASIC